MSTLKQAGIDPKDVDAVVMSHAHIDHCGGCVADDGSRNFPSAQYYITQADYDFWTDETKVPPHPFHDGGTCADRGRASAAGHSGLAEISGAATSGPARTARKSTRLVVNGRAVSTTTVAVLVGAKAVARSGPLAPNTRVALKLPNIKACRVSVVASFPGWYSAITRGKIDVCKTGRVLVRL